MFEDIQKGGMAAIMKYMNDPVWLARVGDKMGDVSALLAGGGGGGGPAAGPAAPAAAPVPDINSLLDAAK